MMAIHFGNCRCLECEARDWTRRANTMMNDWTAPQRFPSRIRVREPMRTIIVGDTIEDEAPRPRPRILTKSEVAARKAIVAGHNWTVFCMQWPAITYAAIVGRE